MNKSEQATTGKRRQARRKKCGRHPARILFVLAGAALAGCFLLGAGKDAGSLTADAAAGSKFQLIESTRVKQAESVTKNENKGAAKGTEDASTMGDWNLILVNPWNSVPQDHQVTLTQLKNGQAVDERCYPSLQKMMDDCRAAGLDPVICSSYRTQEKQESLFQNQVNKLVTRGYSMEEARKEAGKAVAVPGTSEHQLGLAVDIVDLANQNLNESQEKTAVQKWLMENSWRYGFILRYPNDKSEVTGIIYEPWHYRYVGEKAAKEIYEQGICLEEYLEQLKKGA